MSNDKTIKSKLCFLALPLYLLPVPLQAQQTVRDSVKPRWSVSLEVRPRVEYTSNYTLPPNDSVSPYFILTQRNRLSATYERKKWLLHADFQEIHFLDKSYPASKVGNVGFFQLFLETKFNSLNIRVGRQSVLIDNGRIFSDAPWAQQSRAHEGIRIMKKSKRTGSDLLFLFTRKYGNQFEPVFSPVAAHRYQYLLIHHLNYKSERSFSFSTINAMERFKKALNGEPSYRFTSGGRIEWQQVRWYFTLNSLFQFGQQPDGKHLFAYYFQPETRLTLSKLILRLGGEFLSGTSPSYMSKNRSGDFDVLYGVAWKFMGNMNIFTRFPQDVSGKGLINPYFILACPVTKQITLRADSHIFFSQYAFYNPEGKAQPKYLGFENDLSIRISPLKNLEINGGFSFLKSASSMKYLPKITDAQKVAVWSYLMFSYTLNIYQSRTPREG